MLKVAVTASAFSRDKLSVERLKNIFPGEVRLNLKGSRLTKSELIPFLKGCKFSIVGLDQITADILEQCQDLSLISKYGVGLDNIDFNACEKYGVKVVHSKGINRRSVSEEVLGCTLSLLRNLYVCSNKLKYDQLWKVEGGRQLTNKTVGVIGLGHTGKDVIKLLQPFGCKILGNDIIDKNEYFKVSGVFQTSKEEIFREADVITLHTDLNKNTLRMIDKNALSLMKRSAIIINIARGGLIDEQALKEALQEGRIAGAALDVYEVEPAVDRELLEIPNLMCLPHIGGNSEEAVTAMGNAAIDNLMDEIINYAD